LVVESSIKRASVFLSSFAFPEGDELTNSVQEERGLSRFRILCFVGLVVEYRNTTTGSPLGA
jgi:hypothetical protein